MNETLLSQVGLRRKLLFGELNVDASLHGKVYFIDQGRRGFFVCALVEIIEYSSYWGKYCLKGYLKIVFK